MAALIGLGARSFVASDEPLTDPVFDNMIDWLKTVSEGRSKSYVRALKITLFTVLANGPRVFGS